MSQWVSSTSCKAENTCSDITKGEWLDYKILRNSSSSVPSDRDGHQHTETDLHSVCGGETMTGGAGVWCWRH